MGAMSRRAGPQRVFVTTLIALTGAAIVVFLTVRSVSRNPGDANLGAEVIRIRAERMAAEIAERGPAPFQDPHGDRDVYLQHTGDNPDAGWVLVLAYPRGHEDEKRCALAWDARRKQFRSPCEKKSYSADGAGLTTFPAPVKEGKVVIDLR
jgi:hypothetical protein